MLFILGIGYLLAGCGLVVYGNLQLRRKVRDLARATL